MKFLCLAAVYNHKQEWIETLVKSLIDQDHQDTIHVVIIDDRKEGFPAQSFVAQCPVAAARTVSVARMPMRASNLLTKYQYGLNWADRNLPSADAVCVVDDDDIYLSDHISQHAKVLEANQWSYPTKVFSTFGHQFRSEASGGRFWASSAYRRLALDAIGGYVDPGEKELHPAFDQIFLHRMQQAHGEAGHQISPTYTYMWDMTFDNHSSGHIDQGVWKYLEIPESPATGPLVPRYNETALRVLEMARVFRAGN